MIRSLSIYAMVIAALLSVSTSAFSQAAQPSSETADKQAPDPVAAPAVSDPKEIAIYGEVESVNAESNTISVQYYDYDSDSEKTAEVFIGKDAKMENAKSISDIRKGDWVDVTYALSDGKNAARMVSVEKEEPAETAGAATAADMPSDE